MMPVSTHRVRHSESSADHIDFIQAVESKHQMPFKPSRGVIDRMEHCGGE
jgi:hypothetical protein